MTLKLNERQRRMMARLEAEGEIRIGELKDMFGVTEMTIRRDLEKLEQTGQVRRIFGGAILLGKDVALHDRAVVMAGEKARIGSRAAALIQPGEHVFIDGGTTTVEIARALQPGRNITVVTNALNVAHELQEKGITTIVTGGMIWEATSTLIGPFAVHHIGAMTYNRAFLGATGISAQHGFSNSNMHEAEMKRTAIRQASEVNVVADHTKFEAKDFTLFAGIADVQRLITDRLPEGPLLKALEEKGVHVIQV